MNYLFLPIDYIFRAEFDKNYKTNGRMYTLMYLLGINNVGQRTLVVIKNLPIFVDLLLPNTNTTNSTTSSTTSSAGSTGSTGGTGCTGDISESSTNSTTNTTSEAGSRAGSTNSFIESYKYEIVTALRGESFDIPRKFARIRFDNIAERNKFITTYSDKYSLYNDGKFDHLVTVLLKYNTCSWNMINKYETINVEPKIPNQFRITLPDNFAEQTNIVPHNISLTSDSIKDKSIVCAWDLETYTNDRLGDVPKVANLDDKIKMCSMVFKYHWSPDILEICLLTAVPISTKAVANHFNISEARVKIAHIKSEEIVNAFAQVIGAKQPSFLIGYNDGGYDWPFIKRRTFDRAKFLSDISPIKLNKFDSLLFGPMNSDINYKGFDTPKANIIKIDAQNSAIYDGYRIPGIITFDISTILRRINKKETNWSLNYFLNFYKIPLKEDMEYHVMDKIFHLWELTNPKKINEELSLGSIQLSTVLFPNDKKVGKNAINTLTVREILSLFTSTDLIGIYCVRDSEACLDLLTKINLISDIREVTNTSYTHTIDGFYKADGMKVRNCIVSQGLIPKWGLWPEKYQLFYKVYKKYCKKKEVIEKRKYKGGHVIKPKKGIYALAQLENIDEKDKAIITSNTSTTSEAGSRAGIRPSILVGNIDSTTSTTISTASEAGSTEEKIRIIKKYKVNRPLVAADFSSLYPSLMMCYNKSPEYYLSDVLYNSIMNSESPIKDVLLKEKVLKISVNYKYPSEKEGPENKHTGYFIQQQSVFTETSGTFTYINHGIVPTILSELFMKRKAIKRDMGVWATILEMCDKEFKDIEDKNINILYDHLINKANLIEDRAKYFKGKKKELEITKSISYKNAAEIIKKNWCGDFDKTYEKATFYFNYYNTKQNSAKVFMNTFYGEMGNEDSPFFIVTLSGGVTKMGRKSLKFAKSVVEEYDFQVLYGDTDSIYMTASDESFLESDIKFVSGQINKEEYFEEMVGITMEKIDEITKIISKRFIERTGNNLLNMAYEEVLFPYGLYGKKAYFGIAHQFSIDFTLCKIKDVNKFKKDVFIRGLPLRRRDGSIFVKDILAEILMRCCSLENRLDYRDLIFTIIREKIIDTTINEYLYKDKVIKNFSFKIPKKDTHTAQMIYRERMIQFYIIQQIHSAVMRIKNGDAMGYNILSKYCTTTSSTTSFAGSTGSTGSTGFTTNTISSTASEAGSTRWVPQIINVEDCGNDNIVYSVFKLLNIEYIDLDNFEIDYDIVGLNIQFPNYGERLNLVLVRKPKQFKENGNNTTLKKGYFLESPDMLGNTKYAKLLKKLYLNKGLILENDFTDIKIDFKFYFEELYNKLARMLLFIPDYDEIVNNKCEAILLKDSSKLDSEIYKEAEKFAIGKIAKILINMFNNQFPEIKCNNRIIKERFKNKINPLTNKLGTGKMIKLMTKFMGESEYTQINIERDIIKVWEATDFIVYRFNEEKTDIKKIQKLNMKIYQEILNDKKKLLFEKIKYTCLYINQSFEDSTLINLIKELDRDFKEITNLVIMQKIINIYKNDKKMINYELVHNRVKLNNYFTNDDFDTY